MSEQNTNTQLIDYIKENLTGDAQQNALNFVRHLTSLGMSFKDSFNDGRFIYKGKKVCDTYFGNSNNNPGFPEPWTIWGTGDYSKEIESVLIDDRMKEIAWANADYCCNCDGKYCNNDKRKTIFGREFDNVCVSSMAFTDPDNDTVECMKKLMDMRKHAIDNEE